MVIVARFLHCIELFKALLCFALVCCVWTSVAGVAEQEKPTAWEKAAACVQAEVGMPFGIGGLHCSSSVCLLTTQAKNRNAIFVSLRLQTRGVFMSLRGRAFLLRSFRVGVLPNFDPGHWHMGSDPRVSDPNAQSNYFRLGYVYKQTNSSKKKPNTIETWMSLITHIKIEKSINIKNYMGPLVMDFFFAA